MEMQIMRCSTNRASVFRGWCKFTNFTLVNK